MKILFLSPYLLLPLDKGSKIRMYNVIKEFSKFNDITLLSLEDDKRGINLNEIKKFCSAIHTVNHSKSYKTAICKSFLTFKPYLVEKYLNGNFLRKLSYILKKNKFDLVFLNFISMGSYLKPIFGHNLITVVDQHYSDEILWNSYLKGETWKMKAFIYQDLWKLKFFQKKVFKNVDIIFSASQKDAVITKKRISSPNKVWIVPNGVDLGYYNFYGNNWNAKRNNIIYCGSMDVRMNIKAVLDFSKKIFPLIKKRVPEVEFYIVGSNPVPKVKELDKNESIHVTGTVTDVRPFYEDSKVAVIPARYSAGTKLKVLESLAMGVPIVSTPEGIQGITAESGKHLYSASDKMEFVDRVVKLLREKSTWKQISINGRNLVEESYSWKSILKNTFQKLNMVVDSSK